MSAELCQLGVALLLLGSVAAAGRAQEGDAGPGEADPADRLRREGVGEVRWVELSTDSGVVWVAVPADAGPGDTLSGTVRAQGDGEEPGGELAAATVVLTGSEDGRRIAEAPAEGASFTWEVPEDLPSDSRLVLEGPGGETLDEADYSWTGGTALESLTDPRGAEPVEYEYRLPTCGQTGSPLPVLGPFDGRAETTSLRDGEQALEILTESPRGAAFQTDLQGTGPRELVLTEADRRVRGTVHLIGIDLSAGDLHLTRRQRTTLTVRFSGLQGVPERRFPIPYRLVNHDPETVTIPGLEGAVETSEIAAGDVDDEGGYTFTRRLRGLQRGTYNISVSVPWLFDIETEITDLALEGQEGLDLELEGQEGLDGLDPDEEHEDDGEEDADGEDEEEEPRCRCNTLRLSIQVTNQNPARAPRRAQVHAEVPFDGPPEVALPLEWRAGDRVDLELSGFAIDCGCGPDGQAGVCAAHRGSTDHSPSGVRVYPTKYDVGPDNNTVLRGASRTADRYRLTLELIDGFQVDHPYHTIRVWSRCFPADDVCGGPSRLCARSLRLVFR